MVSELETELEQFYYSYFRIFDFNIHIYRHKYEKCAI